MIWKIQKGKISRKFDLKQNKTKSSKQQKKLPSFPCSEGVGRNMWPALFQRSLRQNFKTQLLIFWPQLLIFDTYPPPHPQAFSQPSAFPTAAETKPGSGSPESVHRRFTRANKTARSRSKLMEKWWKEMHGGGEGCFLKVFGCWSDRGGDSRKVNDWRKASNLPRFYTLIRSGFIFLSIDMSAKLPYARNDS